MKPIYDYCVHNKKRILIISDMYLPKNVIENILITNGFTIYDKIFVSNEYNYSKRSGKLFKNVLQELGINRKEIIHIGDSFVADYIMAKKNRIRSILIPKKIQNSKYFVLNKKDTFHLDKCILANFVNNNVLSKNDYYQLGFELLGPLLYGYTNWLYDMLKQYKIKKVYFLAREGNLLKKTFEVLFSDEIESKYLYVSRRSVRVPLLKNIKELEDIFDIVKMRRIVDVESFFINVGLNIKDYALLLEKYNISSIANINDVHNFEDFFKEIKQDIIDNAIKEEKKLIQYLKQEEVKGHIAVVDVGWIGTMQNSLIHVLNEYSISNDIRGFYLGLNPDYKNKDNYEKKFEYMFSNSNYTYDDIAAFLNLFESLFLAQHGSTEKYTEKNDRIIPKLSAYEYSEKEMLLFNTIQKGALDFVEKFYAPLASTEVYLDQLFKFGLNPTLRQLKLFKNMQYVETKKFNFLNSHNLLFYVFHLKQCYIDFCNCSWKIGFMKNLFKVSIDYSIVYKFLIKRM